MPEVDVPPQLRAAAARRIRTAKRLAQLRKQGFKSYAAYLRSSHWRSVKARYRVSDRPQQCMCGETQGLHLHHLTYQRVGAEELADLVLLCGHCHAMVHVLERRGEIGLDFEGFTSDDRAAAYGLEREPEIAQAHTDFAVGRLGSLSEINAARRGFDAMIEEAQAERARLGQLPVDLASDMRAVHRRLDAVAKKLLAQAA